MNLIEHPRLEHLSNTYNIKTWTDTGKEIIIISGSGQSNVAALCMSVVLVDIGMGEIRHLEGIGFGHELMILSLRELYRRQVNLIRLEANPIKTPHGNITEDSLVAFYRGFGFKIDKILSSYTRANGVPMVLKDWQALRKQIKRFIQTMPRI